MHPSNAPSRVHHTATALVEVGWLAAVALLPLVVNPWGLNYELPKVALLRVLTLLMLAAHFLALAWSPRSPDLRRWLCRPLVRPVLLVAGLVLLSTLASVSPLVSLRGSFHRQQGTYLSLCLILWALLVAAHLRTPAQRRRLVTAIVVTGSLVALTPFVETLIQGQNPLVARPGGTLGNPIFLGAYLIMVIPFTLAHLVGQDAILSQGCSVLSSSCDQAAVPVGTAATAAKTSASSVEPSAYADSEPNRRRPILQLLPRRLADSPPGRTEQPCTLPHLPHLPRVRSWRRAGWSLALALQLFALLVTQSRGPGVGALAGLALFAALMLWQRQRRLALSGLLALSLLSGGLVLGLNFGLTPLAGLSQLPYVKRVVLPQGLSSGTVHVRLVLWRAVAEVVTTWPEVGLSPDRLHALRPLLGYGPDTATVVYAAAYPPELAHIQDPGVIWDRAHNETLDLLAMSGWLGVVAYLMLAVACIRRGLALWRAAPDATARAWTAAPLAALLAHAVEVQFAFSMTATALMAWLCVACLATPSQKLGAGESLEETEGRRWRLYAVAGALALAFIALWLEGGLVQADTLAARARAFDRSGQWQESITLYDRALARAPWQASYHQFRAEAFYNLVRALPEEQSALRAQLLSAADRSLARARQLEPLEVGYYSNGGVLHAYWSETVDPAHLEMAVILYEQAFRLAPNRAELHTDLGHVYHNHGRYPEALAQYRAALEIDPQLAAAHYDAGLAWLALGRQDLARAAFQAALDLAPDCTVCQEALQRLQK